MVPLLQKTKLNWLGLKDRYRRQLAVAFVLGLAPLVASATATVVNKFEPDTIIVGDTSKYTLRVSNSSEVVLTAVELTSMMNPDVRIVSIDSTGCGFTGQIVNTPTSGVVLTGGSVPAKSGSAFGECLVTMTVTSNKSGNHPAIIPENTSPTTTTSGFRADENGSIIQNSTSTNVTLGVNSMTAPKGTKTFPANAYEGAPFPLKITLTNPSDKADLALTTFVDNLPTGMTVANVPNISAVSCTGNNPVVTAPAGGTSITLEGGLIPKSGSCEFTVDVVVQSLPGGTENSYLNSIPPGAIGNNRGLISEVFSSSVNVKPALALNKAFANGVVPVNVPTTMTITVTNNGVVPLTNAGFVDVFPAGMTLAPTPNATVTCVPPSGTGGTLDTSNPAQLTWAGGTVPAATTNPVKAGVCTIKADVIMTSEAKLRNELPANAITSNENLSSPVASAELQSFGQLQVSKGVSPTEIAAGQWAQYTITINNYSNAPVTGTSVTDALTAPLVLDYSASPSSTCVNMTFSGSSPLPADNTDGGTRLMGTNGTIPAATGVNPGSCTVTFRARLPEGSTAIEFKNNLPVGSVSGAGSQNTNTVSSGGTTVDAVKLSKRFTGSTEIDKLPAVSQGQNATLYIDIANRYVTDLTGVNLVDNLIKIAPGITLAADPQPKFTCGSQASVGTLDARPFATEIKLSGATIPARPAGGKESICTIEVQVTGKTPGTFTNQIDPADFTNDKFAQVKKTSAILVVYAGISAKKVFNPEGVVPGAISRATVSITNGTNSQLTNVTMVDDGMVGIKVANPANAATTCSGTASLTANPGSTSVHLAGAVIPAGATCDVSFDVETDSAAGTWSNTIPVGQITSSEKAFNSSSVEAFIKRTSAELSLNKSFSETFVQGNAPTILKLTLSNNSNEMMRGVAFSDSFPAGMQIYSEPDISTTCSGATVAATPGDAKVVITGANIAPGNSCVTYVTVTSSKYLNLTNTIPAGAVTSQGGYTNKDPAIATVSTLEALGVSKGFTPAVIQADGTSRLKITLINTFSSTSPRLTGVSFTDTLPDNLLVADPPNATTTCAGPNVTVNVNGQNITLTNATLNPNQSCDLEIDVTSSTKGTYVNEIPKGSVTTDQKVTNEVPGKSTLVVDEGPDVKKKFDPPVVSVGEKSVLTVNVTNNAEVALTGVTLPDNLPSGMTVANPPNAGTSCLNGEVTGNPGDVRVELNGATIAATKSCEFWIDVMSNKTGKLVNTIAKDALTSNQGLTNGNPTESPLIVRTPPEVSKSFHPVKIDIAGTSTLLINLKNANIEAITLTKLFADALPANVYVHATPNINGVSNTPASALPACSTGSVAIADGNTRVTYASGATIPVGGCSIWVDVTSSVKGSYLNKIEPGQLQTTAGVNPEPAVATIGVDGLANPTIKKSFSENVINPGQPTTLTIEMNNPNDEVLTLATSMTDQFPANLKVATPDNLSHNCPSEPVLGADSVTYPSGAVLPINGGCTISVDVTSDTIGTHNNVIAKGGLSTTEGGDSPEETSDGITVVPEDDPTVLKAFEPKFIAPGQTSVLTITLGNKSARTATLLSALVDRLPADISLVLPNRVGGTCMDYGTIDVGVEGSFPTLYEHVSYMQDSKIPPGGCTIEVDVTSRTSTRQPDGSEKPHVNVIGAGELKTDLGNNQVPTTAELFVSPDTPPGVQKKFNESTMAPGGTVALEITLSNVSVVKNATLLEDLVDTLPGDMKVVGLDPAPAASACPSTVIAVPGSNKVIYPKGSVIPMDTSCTIVVFVTATAPTSPNPLINKIDKGALKTDLGSNTTPTTAEVEVLTSTGLASIAGNVYHDRNNDGLIGKPTEEGVGAVTVILERITSSGLTFVAEVTTNPDGSYKFPNLVPGDQYIVRVVHPEGWINGKDTKGDKGGDDTAQNDQITAITLISGANGVEYNFGLRKPATLSGKVYHDRNDDGTVDPKEEGVGDVTITITWTDKTTGKTVTKETKTDPSGNYTFTDLPPDTEYTVTKKHPDGWINGKDTAGTHGGTVTDDVIGKVTLTSGDEAKEYNYGLRKKASIAGKVYHDKNDDGDLNSKDVGVADVEVQLTWVDASGTTQTKSTKTAADGSYSFPDLEADLEYTVTKVHPKGWEDRKDNVGSHGGVANQDDVISMIKLSSGDQGVEYNFGLYRKEVDLNPVPTMSQWGLILMSLMLMGFAAVRQRKTLNQRQ